MHSEMEWLIWLIKQNAYFIYLKIAFEVFLFQSNRKKNNQKKNRNGFDAQLQKRNIKLPSISNKIT